MGVRLKEKANYESEDVLSELAGQGILETSDATLINVKPWLTNGFILSTLWDDNQERNGFCPMYYHVMRETAAGDFIEVREQRFGDGNFMNGYSNPYKTLRFDLISRNKGDARC